IEFDPNYALTYSNRGATYHDMEKYDLALADYQKAIGAPIALKTLPSAGRNLIWLNRNHNKQLGKC
ncbi:MAG: tetratricopeptide repeat protein, partial [Bacteroidota bacterium]